MNTSLYLICTGWNFVTAEYLTASSSISIHVLILPVYQCVALLFNFCLPYVLDRKNSLLMYSLDRKNTEIMTSFDRFTNSIDFLKESEASFSWLTSGGSESCHSSEERNKENHNLMQTVPVIHYSRRESSSVHDLKGLFIQISEEIIFFSDVWNFRSTWSLLSWEEQQSSNYQKVFCWQQQEEDFPITLWTGDVNIYLFYSRYMNYLKR